MGDPLHDQLQHALGSAYTIERELSGGGMSRVFLARDAALDRKVVVKVLPPEMAAAVSSERFRREIALAAKLQHPHIVPLLTAGDAGGLPYFTMPFIEGESLRVRLARHGELPVAEAMRLLRELASALAYAHERGIVHRDIKPDNVLLSGGSAMVTDFGVAKALSASSNDESTRTGAATSLGVALGTPAYMSPEQATADPGLDHRADIYAFGVVAYEVLTGQPPFSGRTPQGLLAAHVTESPEAVQRRRTNLPPALAALVMRCLEKRAADRPQKASEVVHALDDINTPSGGMQPTGAVAATGERPGAAATEPRPTLRWRLGVTVAAAVAIAAVALVLVQKKRAPSTPATGPAAIRSIAVTPLVNASSDTADIYFANGMTDEVTSVLAQIPGVRVASRSAVAAVDSGRNLSAAEVGRRLNVGAVFGGRIRRQGTRLRLVAELVNTEDGLSIWSQTYERDVKDAFAVQDEVARAIASALQLTLAPTPVAAARRTANPKAHDLVLRARFQQDLYTEKSLRQAIALYEEALALDSGYVAAWSGLAGAWGSIADDFIPAKEAMPHMQRALERGLALDSTAADMQAEYAVFLELYKRDYDAAERGYARAFALDSTLYTAPLYAHFLLRKGLPDSAIAVLRRFARANPASTHLARQGMAIFMTAGTVAEARDACRSAIELDSARFANCRVSLLMKERRFSEALAACRPTSHHCRGIAYLAMGRRDEALRESQAFAAGVKERQRAGEYVDPGYRAAYYAEMGDKERVLEMLDSAWTINASILGQLRNQTFAWLKGDPRFEAHLRRAGIK